MNLSIAKDFSDVPWGRFPADSEHCGENFREKILVPRLRGASITSPVVVDLDGVEGFGSSFLEEAFGGLVRHGYFKKEQVRELMRVTSSHQEFQMYVKLIWKYIDSAKFGCAKPRIGAL